MANVLESQITHEGPRNVVIKLTGILTDSDITETAVDITQFTSNENVASGLLAGFRVDLIEYSIAAGLEVVIAWDGNSPQQIFPLAGRGRFAAFNYGGFIPDMTRSGYNGNIVLSTKGFPQGTTQTFTVVLELIKLYK